MSIWGAVSPHAPGYQPLARMAAEETPRHPLKAVSLLSDSLVPFALSPHIQYPAWEWRRELLDKVGLLQQTYKGLL